MTLQVGFVGTDGVVLASDTKWSEMKQDVKYTFARSKLMINEGERIAVSAARKMGSSMNVAKAIIDTIKGSEWISPEYRIEQIAGEIVNAMDYAVRDLNCLIVSPRLRLYRLEMVTDLSKGAESMPSCWEQTDKACAGDTLNNALFWGERYYQRQSVRNLIRLAAHLIGAGCKLSPDRIDGLEIVVCDKDGVHRLSDESIRELQATTEGLDEHLRISLSNGFIYKSDGV